MKKITNPARKKGGVNRATQINFVPYLVCDSTANPVRGPTPTYHCADAQYSRRTPSLVHRDALHSHHRPTCPKEGQRTHFDTLGFRNECYYSQRRVSSLQARKGHNQFERDTFSKLDDVKDVIDKWADNAAKRLKELRDSRGGS